MSTDSNPHRTPAGVPTGGQFAASAKSEASVGLDTDRPFASLPEDSAAALEAVFPGGRAITHGDEALTYEDASGNSYTIRFRRLARGEQVNVTPDDDYGYPSTAHRMTDIDGFIDPDDVVDCVGRVLDAAHKRRGYREGLDKFVEVTGDSTSGWSTNGDYAYTFGRTDNDDYVRFGHFDYTPGTTRPNQLGKSLDRVQFSLGSHPDASDGGHDADKQIFEARRTDTQVHYFDHNQQRLAPWQVSALEKELAWRGAPSPAGVLNSANHEGSVRLGQDKGTHQ